MLGPESRAGRVGGVNEEQGLVRGKGLVSCIQQSSVAGVGGAASNDDLNQTHHVKQQQQQSISRCEYLAVLSLQHGRW
jgi:hypothetical protein